MGLAWEVHGTYIGLVWEVRGNYMGLAWDLLGTYMGASYSKEREKTEKSDWQFPLRGEICQSDSVE